MSETARHLIGGEWVSGGSTGESVNPATGEVLGTFADGGEAEARAAVGAAVEAFETTGWAREPATRTQALLEMADAFDAHADGLTPMLTAENGKTLSQAEFETRSAGATLRFAAATAQHEQGVAAEISPGVHFETLAEPIGVAGIITPWNSPLALLVRSLAPALAAGTATVVKMPSQTALFNARIFEVITEAKALPPGIVNFFNESGNAGAPYLVSAPEVPAISYTGSVPVGRAVMAAGSAQLKRLNLELGGKAPLLVFEDADLEVALPLIVAAITTFAGEFCMAGTRVLVAAPLAEEVGHRLTEMLEAVKIGPGDQAGVQMGPLVDKANVGRVEAIAAEAARSSRTLLRGGPIVDGPLAAGAFFRPALFEVEDLSNPLVQQEVFAPVVTLEKFADESEAVRRANATDFGLAATVFTTNVDRSRRVGRGLKFGTVWTNAWSVLNDGFEEGGFKQSGLGRLRGTLGVRAFQELKTYVHSETSRA
jgi:betaine-aldehyde dehydrogenase